MQIMKSAENIYFMLSWDSWVIKDRQTFKLSRLAMNEKKSNKLCANSHTPY